MNEWNAKVVASVIMPAYNEEESVEACFYRVVEVLEDYGKPYEIILEEDGSTDRTPEVMDRLAEKYACAKVLHFPRRMGKGFGVRKCLEMVEGECIVLIDADMEYPADKMPDLIEKIDENDIVVGSRSAWINRKGCFTRLIRVLLSRVYGFLVARLFAIDLQDYQSGFKVFKREVIETIQPLTSSGFEIDSEILLKAKRKGFKIGFVPIVYTFKGNSNVNLITDPIKMLLSLLKWKLDSYAGTGSFDLFPSDKSMPATESLQLNRALSKEESGRGDEAEA